MKKILSAVGSVVLSGAFAFGACGFENKQQVRMFSNSFPAWEAVTSAMSECGNFTATMDKEFRKKQPAAFASKPSLYEIAGISNSTLEALLQDGSVRPLDSLVEQYGQNLKPNQLIRINGKIMAIATMVNNQHFMYRKDIFDKLDIKEPKTYADVIKAAKTIQKAGVVDYPYGGTFKAGWNLAQEFVNMYLGLGGKFFDKRGKRLTINNKTGVKALEQLKALSEYMDPEYLTSDSTFVQKQFHSGKIAMGMLWGSRAAGMNDAKETKFAGQFIMAKAPAAKRGGKPASTLWWDGLAIATNITDQEAENAFKVLLEGIDRDMVEANNDIAVWLINGYKPSAVSRGVIETAESGTPSYPSSAKMAIVHSALGKHVSDFLIDKKSARAVLKAIIKDYKIAVKEKGLK